MFVCLCVNGCVCVFLCLVCVWFYDRSGRLKINSLQALVLDEFDALLEYKPHRDPTRAIMQALKRRHGDGLQSILCSATATDSIDKGGIDGFLRPGYVTAMADEKDLLVVDANKNKNDKNKKESTLNFQAEKHICYTAPWMHINEQSRNLKELSLQKMLQNSTE